MTEIFAADFEGSIEEDVIYEKNRGNEFARVYLWTLQNIKDCFTDIVFWGRTIKSFMLTIEQLPNNSIIYFHNLRYDGHFILDYCARNFVYADLQYDIKDKGTYSTVITQLGQWFSIDICFLNGRKIHFLDSTKRVAKSIEKISKTFDTKNKIGIEKSELPLIRRAPYYHLTDIEIKRCINDTRILSYFLNFVLHRNDKLHLPKMTIASNAFSRWQDGLTSYKKQTTNQYRKIFPLFGDINEHLRMDNILRDGYYGGWCYVNPIHQNKVLNNVTKFDKNSMYPTMLFYEKMPYGLPSEDPIKDGVYLTKIDVVDAVLKKNKLPFIQDHLANVKIPEMLTHYDGELVLAQPMYELFKENYSYSECGKQTWWFHSSTDYFKDYISYFYELKKNTNDEIIREAAKLFLNSLYGKFGERLERRHKIIQFNEQENMVDYILSNNETLIENPVGYLPLAMFCTAYSRKHIVKMAQSFGNRFVYSDTDSLHILNATENDLKGLLSKELGDWKNEGLYVKAKYLKPKTYLGEFADGHKEMHAAGFKCPDPDNFSFDDFIIGNKVTGKMVTKTCPGGCYLKSWQHTL